MQHCLLTSPLVQLLTQSSNFNLQALQTGFVSFCCIAQHLQEQFQCSTAQAFALHHEPEATSFKNLLHDAFFPNDTAQYRVSQLSEQGVQTSSP